MELFFYKGNQQEPNGLDVIWVIIRSLLGFIWVMDAFGSHVGNESIWKLELILVMEAFGPHLGNGSIWESFG